MNVFECATLGRISGVAHGFFGRQGGVSEGLFASLNCGFGSGDDVERVRENRTRAARRLGIEGDQLLTVYQIHSPNAVIVEHPWTRDSQPKADAMATRTRGVALGILTADCAPVLMADERAGVIGVAHAGWKGALGGVVEGAVGAMEKLGARREHIAAAIGPCISQASYEVGAEFRDAFLRAGTDNDRYFVPGKRASHFQFDLPGYVQARLEAMQLASVRDVARCTYADDAGYFSFRRTTHRGEPDYGRNLSAIVLAP